jgi:hypothetical protein
MEGIIYGGGHSPTTVLHEFKKGDIRLNSRFETLKSRAVKVLASISDKMQNIFFESAAKLVHIEPIGGENQPLTFDNVVQIAELPEQTLEPQNVEITSIPESAPTEGSFVNAITPEEPKQQEVEETSGGRAVPNLEENVMFQHYVPEEFTKLNVQNVEPEEIKKTEFDHPMLGRDLTAKAVEKEEETPTPGYGVTFDALANEEDGGYIMNDIFADIQYNIVQLGNIVSSIKNYGDNYKSMYENAIKENHDVKQENQVLKQEMEQFRSLGVSFEEVNRRVSEVAEKENAVSREKSEVEAMKNEVEEKARTTDKKAELLDSRETSINEREQTITAERQAMEAEKQDMAKQREIMQQQSAQINRVVHQLNSTLGSLVPAESEIEKEGRSLELKRAA